MKKIEKAAQFLTEQIELFQCPLCESSFHTVEGNSLICTNGHNFNLSKKGTIHFLTKTAANEYSTEMLSARYRIAQAGLFQKMLRELYTHIEEKEGTTIDVGSGEGSQLHYLSTLGLAGTQIGFDISKDAIGLAGSHFTNAFWCVADLAHSPFAGKRYDTILNIFSPSNYEEFKRMLKSEGRVLKIVPDQNYLRELRNILYRDKEEKQSYTNELVVEKFKEHFPSSQAFNIEYTFPLTPSLYEDLINMTPLSWGASKEAKEYAMTHPLKEITIHVCLLIGEKEEK